MLSTELEYLCTWWKCFLQCWNAFDRVGVPLYGVGMLSTVVECFLEGWNAFDRVGIPLYRVEMLPTVLE
jgi:ABC-type glycerol-3-phosphate transport system permease component